MRLKTNFLLFYLFLITSSFYGQSNKFAIHTVAFYNFENLFDTINNTNKDEEWLPNGTQVWTSRKYQEKIKNLGKVISKIGTSENNNAPILLGATEIENRGVLEDLVKDSQLINLNYGIIHFDSPDQRGIDVALLYQKKYFKPIVFKNIPLYLSKKKLAKNKEGLKQKDFKNFRVYTRDVLLVKGELEDSEIYILVNHWPSRSGGVKKSNKYREEAAHLNRAIIDSLFSIDPKANIITMGDFNDGPYNKSIKEGLKTKDNITELALTDLYNPFETMQKKGHATIFYRDVGDIYDQIIVSKNLISEQKNTFKYWKAGIYNSPFLINNSGKYKGYPLRHSANQVGFSDHFPVYIYLIKRLN